METPSIQFKRIEELPELSGRKGPRESVCLSAYVATRDSATQKVEVVADPECLDKFYKSMVQWRSRHREFPVQVRKDGGRVFLWIDL